MVYSDVITTTARVITKGEIVFPGIATISRFPTAAEYLVHFRKTFTADSGPITRGETPEVEFAKTSRIHTALPGNVPNHWDLMGGLTDVLPYSGIQFTAVLLFPIFPTRKA